MLRSFIRVILQQPAAHTGFCYGNTKHRRPVVADWRQIKLRGNDN